MSDFDEIKSIGDGIVLGMAIGCVFWLFAYWIFS